MPRDNLCGVCDTSYDGSNVTDAAIHKHLEPGDDSSPLRRAWGASDLSWPKFRADFLDFLVMTDQIDEEVLNAVFRKKWILVEEEKPDHDEEVFIWPTCGPYTIAFYDKNESPKTGFFRNGNSVDPTHWMRIPGPPIQGPFEEGDPDGS